MPAPIEYINKTICNITSRFKIKHQVKFGKKNHKGNRNDPVYLYEYDSENYDEKQKLSGCNLDTSDYLILEYSNDDNEKICIYLSYPHIYNFKIILKKALNWFYNKKYEDMFIENDDELKFNSKYKKQRLSTNITVDKKIFSIRPSVVQKDEVYCEGVIVSFCEGEALFTLDLYELENLYDVINNFNLYQSSLILTNFALSIKPQQIVCLNSFSKINNKEVFKKRKRIQKEETSK